MNKDSWKWKTLGSISDIHDYKRKPITKKDRKIGIYPYYGATGIQDYIDNYIFDGSFVLVGEDGAKWGANENTAFLINGKFWVNNHAHVLQMHNDIFPKWVVYYLNHKDLNEFITGAVVPKLNQAALRSIPIPVPFISIQKQIVEELDTLSDIITKKKEQLAELDKLAQATFYDMFGDPVENEKGWDIRGLEKICTQIVDCPHSTPIKSETKTLYPCIRTSELKNGSINWDSMQYVEQEEYLKRTKRLTPKAGDIIYGREGSYGDAVCLPNTGHNFCLGQRTMLFRPNSQILNSTYLLKFIISDYVYSQARNKNAGSTVGHVNVSDIKKFNILCPPLSLQNQFAEKIEAIEQQKELINQSITNVQLLFDYTMDKYFN